MNQIFEDNVALMKKEPQAIDRYGLGETLHAWFQRLYGSNWLRRQQLPDIVVNIELHFGWNELIFIKNVNFQTIISNQNEAYTSMTYQRYLLLLLFRFQRQLFDLE